MDGEKFNERKPNFYLQLANIWLFNYDTVVLYVFVKSYFTRSRVAHYCKMKKKPELLGKKEEEKNISS